MPRIQRNNNKDTTDKVQKDNDNRSNYVSIGPFKRSYDNLKAKIPYLLIDPGRKHSYENKRHTFDTTNDLGSRLMRNAVREKNGNLLQSKRFMEAPKKRPETHFLDNNNQNLHENIPDKVLDAEFGVGAQGEQDLHRDPQRKPDRASKFRKSIEK